MTLSPRQRYARDLLELYRRTPDTPPKPRRADRILAAALYDRRIPLQIVHAALLLAAARRARRPDRATPLAPIATLHYFLPIIDELIAAPPDPGYLAYLRQTMATLAPALADADHQLP